MLLLYTNDAEVFLFFSFFFLVVGWALIALYHRRGGRRNSDGH
jgi:hypothetical protein